MHITILAHGSRGDVQPYVALALGFQRTGHTVCLAAPQLFESFIANHGLAFAPLAGDPPRLAQALADRAGWNPLRTGYVIAEYTLPLARQVIADVRVACQDAEVIIHSFLTTIAGHQVARELNLPDFSALIFPVFAPTGAFPCPPLPAWPLGRLYNRLTHHFFTQSFWQASRLAYNLVLRRQDPHLPPLAGWPWGASKKEQPPILYGISPHVIPRPTDWDQHQGIHLTGYWFIDTASNWQPPPDLVDFLAAGAPPVYLGFGSMITKDGPRLAKVVLAALAQTGSRAVLLSGWGKLGLADLPDDLFSIESVPHDWLFPRMAAIVHHGGAGTTAAALRSGVPEIIVPFTADQPFWGRRVHQLGVGPKPIPRHKLTAECLAGAIAAATGDQTMRGRAAELGERIRTEDGVAQAVAIIERYLARTK